MNRIVFLLKLKSEADLKSAESLKSSFEEACRKYDVDNFSIWKTHEYLFAYGENHSENEHCFDTVFAVLPDGVILVCAPGTMKLMYHDIGIVRSDKSLIRHRVFATRLKPGCADEYKRRHDGLISARAGKITEGPESNFTIWFGDGHIFGYCELVRSYDGIEQTEEQKAATIAWETRQLEIMDWLTDDVDWLTGEKHPAIQRIL